MSDSETLSMLLDQAARLFEDMVDRDLLMTVEDGIWPQALWDAVEQFGLPDALTVPAGDGGLTFADAAGLFALIGEHAVPAPVGETMLARAVLARAGIDAPAGPTGVLAADGSATFAVQHYIAQAGDRLQLLSGGDAQAAPNGISRMGRVQRPAPEALLAEADWPRDVPPLETLGAMLRASQIAGAVRRTLSLSVDYANTRQQFGRPIGRFQAVQQLLAKLAAEAAAAQSTADVAWSALDAQELGHAGAIAKIRAGAAVRCAAAIAHQVHGAIGMTDEHMLHYTTRRMWEWRTDFGSEGAWAQRLGAALRQSREPFWNFLITRCGAPAMSEAR